MSRPKGRPTKCDTQKILDAERIQKLGATDIITAEYLGIQTSTFYDWIRKGEQNPKSIYGQFAEAVKRGRSQCGIVNLATIQAAARAGQWTAAAWMLERRYGYKNVVETEQRNQPDSIDLETEEGRQQAVDMLNQLPISILKNIDHRRLYAALDAGEE
tara:strand:+ start:125 stop:598 length:474 start_codon:yes stop_codon:yes gene_type:complete